MKRTVQQATRRAEAVKAAIGSVEEQIKEHTRWDSSAYETLAQLIGEVAEALQLPANNSSPPVAGTDVAELVFKVRDYLAKHVREDVDSHGKMLGEVAHVKSMISDLISRYYELLDEVEKKKEKSND